MILHQWIWGGAEKHEFLAGSQVLFKCIGPYSPCSRGHLPSSRLLGSGVPLDNSGHPGLWHATAAAAAAATQRLPQRLGSSGRSSSRGGCRGSRANPPGLAWVRAGARPAWRGGAWGGGRGLAHGGGARRAGLALSALRGGGRGRGHGQRAARRGVPGSPPKGKARRARWRVLPGSRISPGASGPQTRFGRPGHLPSIQGPAAELGVCMYGAAGARAGGLGTAAGTCGHPGTSGLGDNFAQRSYSKFPLLLLS